MFTVINAGNSGKDTEKTISVLFLIYYSASNKSVGVDSVLSYLYGCEWSQRCIW